MKNNCLIYIYIYICGLWKAKSGGDEPDFWKGQSVLLRDAYLHHSGT